MKYAICFFEIVSKKAKPPRWLIEGVSIYLSGQNKYKKPILEFTTFYKWEERDSRMLYYESGFAVELLVEKYGKKKLIKLISSLNTIKNEKDFSKLFKKIYGITLDSKTFNMLLEKVGLKSYSD